MNTEGIRNGSPDFMKRASCFSVLLIIGLVTLRSSIALVGQEVGTVVFLNLGYGVNAPDYLCDSSTRLF